MQAEINEHVRFAGFNTKDRANLTLDLEANINEQIIVGEVDGLNIINEPFILDEVQGLGLPRENRPSISSLVILLFSAMMRDFILVFSQTTTKLVHFI